MNDKADEVIYVLNEQGERVTLQYNEPRPDLEVQERPSRFVEQDVLGLAGLRMQVEAILDRRCGPSPLPELLDLGPQAAQILIKIAAEHGDCEDFHCHRRGAAVTALGFFPLGRVVDYLKGLLQDRRAELDLRARSALSLGRIGSPSCIASLSLVLDRYRSPALRRAAAKGLGMSRSLEALGSLEAAVKGDRDPSVKYQAYMSLRTLEKIYNQRLSLVEAPLVPGVGKPEPVPAPRQRSYGRQRGGRS